MNSIAVENLSAGYGAVRVLDGISLSVNDGETVTLLGTNGNGKSTLMKCIMGIVPSRAGRITATMDGVEHNLAGRATEDIVNLGIALIPEGRRLFPRLTVEENLAGHRCAGRELVHPVEAPQHRGLAAARWSEDGGDRMRRKQQRHIADRPELSEQRRELHGLEPQPCVTGCCHSVAGSPSGRRERSPAPTP